MSRMFKRAIFFLYSLKYKFIRFKFNLLPIEFNKTFIIPISSIKYKISDNPKIIGIENSPIGGVKGGDWDLNTNLIKDNTEKSLKYKGLYEHFKQNIPWEETCLFRIRYKGLFERKKIIRGCKDLESLTKFYENQYDTLYKSIKENGIKTGKKEYDIYVYINRNGEYIYTYDGNHRFYIALLLGIEFLPVKVILRHQLWYEKLKEANEDYFKKKIEVPLVIKNHPDYVLVNKKQ